ncbi:NADAR family protein [Streptomyces sp. NPDC056883]|uniref:NADAR family protein n=1 Tax=Streptomyces sp. NPDC056883 TaxID=3345959 RepID=UPI00368F7ADA
MINRRTTHRIVDGVHIPGTWRPAFIRNGRYFLTDLFIYADGLVDCWGLVTLEEFEEKVRSGWVATTLPEGAPAAIHGLARWTFGEPRNQLTPDLLIAEVRDTVDRLNERPDSAGRCMAAVRAFLADRTEENRAAARAAFLAVPVSRRRAMGDMDGKDWNLRVLVAGPGGRTYLAADPPVTQEAYERAVAHFEQQADRLAELRVRASADGPLTAYAPAVHLHPWIPNDPVAEPGRRGLHNTYPAPITVDQADYPSVSHAYWALSAAQPEVRAAIAAAATPAAARDLAVATPRREGWEHARTAVMAGLLRAKYDQHPELAEILLATGDATLVYEDISSAFWGEGAGRGRNWTGRLLELVRSELHMRRAGIPGP